MTPSLAPQQFQQPQPQQQQQQQLMTAPIIWLIYIDYLVMFYYLLVVSAEPNFIGLPDSI